MVSNKIGMFLVVVNQNEVTFLDPFECIGKVLNLKGLMWRMAKKILSDGYGQGAFENCR